MLFDDSRILEKQANLVVIHKLLLSQEYILKFSHSFIQLNF